MANDAEYKIKIGAESTQADGALDAFAAKQARVKAELEEATAAAQQWGVSVEKAQVALAQIRTEDFNAEVAALKNAMREADVDTTTSAESAAEQTERMQRLLSEHQQKLMQNTFYVHRLAEGFKDLSMGGRAASQGLMDISETLQYMVGPTGGIYFAILQVVGMLALMATRHREAAGAAKDHAEDEKTAAEQVQQALTNLNEAIKQGYDERTKAAEASFATIGHAYDEEANKVNALVTATKELQRAQDELNDAKLAAQVANLDLKEQGELNGAQGAGAREAITQKYDAERLQLRQQAGLQKAADDVDARTEELAAAKKARDDAQLKLFQQQQDIADKKAAVESAAVSVPSDLQAALAKQTKLQSEVSGGTATGQDFVDLQDIIAKIPALQENEKAKGGPQYDEQLADLQKQLADTQKQQAADIDAVRNDVGPAKDAARFYDTQTAQADLDKAANLRRQIQQVQDRQSAQEALASSQKDFATAQEKATPEMVKLNAAVEAASIRLTAALQREDNQSVVDLTDLRKGQAAQNEETQKELRQARDNELEASRLRLQAALDQAPEGSKPAIQRKLNDVENQAATNKQNDELGIAIMPTFDGVTPQAQVDQSIKDRTAAQIEADNAKTASVVTKDDSAHAHASIESTVGEIEAAATAPGFSRAGEAELHRRLQGILDQLKGKTDEASQTAALAQLQSVHVEDYANFKEQTTQKIKSIDASLKRLKNHSL